jgi:hypothetical protein
MAKPNDASVFAHIEALVAEEHKLFEEQGELDQYWDVLRQRRALREYGRDPAQAQERDADTVKKYIG